MSKVNQLTITVSLTERQEFEVQCQELNEVVVAPYFNMAFSSLMKALPAKVLELRDARLLSETPLTLSLVDEETEEKLRYEQFLERLELAFVKAYPAAANYGNVISLIPCCDWEDEVWEAKEETAYNALIERGGLADEWVAYIQEITALVLPWYVESQQFEVYQEWVSLGLPVLPIEQILSNKDRVKLYCLPGDKESRCK